MTPSDSIIDFLNKTKRLGENLASITSAADSVQRMFQAQSVFQAIVRPPAALTAWMSNSSLYHLKAAMTAPSVVSGLRSAIQRHIPKMPFDSLIAIDRIIGHQTDLFESLARINRALPQAAVQQQHLFTSLKGLTNSYINIAIQKSERNLLDTLDNVNEDVAMLATHLSTTNEWGAEEQTIIKRLINRLEVLSDKVPKIVLKIVAVVMTLINIQMYIAYLTQRPAATVENLKAMQMETIRHIDSLQAKQDGYRTINMNCRVYQKPSAKSMKIMRLKRSTKVLILHKNHKWLLIGYKNDTDNVLQTGWLLKKNTTAP